MGFLQAIEGSLSWIVFVVGMRVIMAKEIQKIYSCVNNKEKMCGLACG